MGFSYHTNKGKAQQSLNEFKKQYGSDFDSVRSGIDEAEFPISAKGMIDALGRWGEHNDNG